MTEPSLYPCFLGPYGENDALLERLVVEFLRDHVYWRRNLYPEDPPAIPTRAAQQPAFQEFEARLRRELHTLSASLKRSVPFHSPRYLGHMVSDLLLPGLAAQILALPYNPNNVSDEAAPVTIDLEIKVGLQLARLLGYVSDPEQDGCAFGHLTSGGTLANFQALRLALALKCFPVALRAAAPPGMSIPEDDMQAFRLTPAQAIDLLVGWQGWLSALEPQDRVCWRKKLEAERIEQLGGVRFFATHPELAPPVVLAPVTAHYSWSKGMKMLGLGREQLVLIPERGMRLDITAFEQTLRDLDAAGASPLLAVAVFGTTEFGTIDPVHELVALRERRAAQGKGFAIHVDAAWGGYLATLFRQEDGTLRSLQSMRAEFTSFPSANTHAAMAALGQADSITVDPHKLGYLAYGAGAFVCRDHRAMELLTETADYVFTGAAPSGYFNRYRKLGQYIPEGSKSGAAAAAVYVTHRVLPLDHTHFGQLVRQTIRATEAFVARAEQFAREMRSRLRVCVPYPPDSNLVCIAANPAGNLDVTVANAFMRQIHGAMSMDSPVPLVPLQNREFFGSTTTLREEILGTQDMHRILDELGLDTCSMRADDPRSDRLLILRHTLMNPFIIDDENGISYIDRYFEYLSRRVALLLPAKPSSSTT
ncbi:pyridoxal-dependent decarboxylase [Metallibacterium sp.]|uniref:pyridoxal phosphate-dependent decarboxylase family protein n=1 Tax=Metallibacterium sp. TaxID=2940281 RepID=UPI00262D7380|nr:pyridoxal-dependent decarboxylase [Metallibacterium sp.]